MQLCVRMRSSHYSMEKFSGILSSQRAALSFTNILKDPDVEELHMISFISEKELGKVHERGRGC